MRLPSFPTLIRTFYALTNTTRPLTFQRGLNPFGRALPLKSMPTIPLIGSLFSSSTSSNMSYPDTRSDDEWRAVLNKGRYFFLFFVSVSTLGLRFLQNNSVFSVRRGPKHQGRANMISITLIKASITAPAAVLLSTSRTINSNQGADGLRTSTLCPVR